MAPARASGSLDAGDEDGRLRELLGKGRHERDRPADADVDRLHAPGIGEGRAPGHRPALGVRREAVAPIVEVDLDPRPTGMVEQVLLERLNPSRSNSSGPAASRSSRGRGTSVFEDVATVGASMPMVVIDGFGPDRDRIDPEPIR